MTLIVYIYGVAPHFNGLAFYTQMAANTAANFMVVSLGLLAVKPDYGMMHLITSDSAAGIIIRRLLPAIFLIDIGLRWILLAGEQQGLYDHRFDISLSVFLSIVIFAILVLSISWSIYRLEDQREQVKHALSEAENAINKAVMVSLRKDESLASTSHELRSPLQGIIAGSSMLLQGMLGPMSEKQTEYVALIKSSGEHILQIINDLLDIAKIEAGKLTIQIQEIPIKDVVEEAFQLVEPLSSEKDQIFSVHLADCLPATMQSDPVRLKQILCNLLTNAIKFTPPEKRIWLHASLSEQNEIVFSIRDEGPGIPESDIDKILQPYEQGEQTNLSNIKGTGLGLHLTKKLIDMLGGRFKIHSQEGTGSEFTIYLPLNP